MSRLFNFTITFSFILLMGLNIAPRVDAQVTQKIIFYGSGGTIYTLNLDGSGLTLIGQDGGGRHNPELSPNGLKIAYDHCLQNQSGPLKCHIYTMNSDGTNVVDLAANSNTQDSNPTWSPDGTKIAFTRYENDPYTSKIFVFNADGTNAYEIASNATRPTWSPDGTKIAYTIGGKIAVSNVDGSNQTIISAAFGCNGNGYYNYPAWSPDGTRIAVMANSTCNNNYNIATMKTDGTDVIVVTTGKVTVPSWTPDSSKILYSSGTNYEKLYLVNATGGIPQQFYAQNTSINNPKIGNYMLPPQNTSPTLLLDEQYSVNEGQLLQFTVDAIDPDGDMLFYSAANLPPGATFNPFTRIFSWIPDYTQEGNYPDIEFTVTDDGDPIGLDVKNITITVGGVNRAPVFEPVGSQEVLENDLLTFTVNATDPDGDSFTLATTDIPTGATFNSQSGTFSWTPNLSQQGNYVVTFNATDTGIPVEIGQTEVSITVGDNPTPVEQAQNLVSVIVTYDLPTNVENSYLANTKKVEIFIEQGKIQPAINQLDAFIDKVEQDYSAGIITLGERNNLVNLAQALIADLQ